MKTNKEARIAEKQYCQVVTLVMRFPLSRCQRQTALPLIFHHELRENGKQYLWRGPPYSWQWVTVQL